MATPENAIEVHGLTVRFGQRAVLDGLSFSVPRGSVTGVIGPSGSGKSVTLRAILGLVRADSGDISLFGSPVAGLDSAGQADIRRQTGVLFQQGALFSSLTVLENVELPMREHLRLDAGLVRKVARTKLEMSGLPRHAGDLYPAELSGGMIKRAALARALALDPKILFLDEPTAGLDPIGASAFDALVLELRDTLDLTVYMVTHDLDSLGAICDRIVAMAGGKVLRQGTLDEVRADPDPWINEYFGGPRARRIGERD